MKDTIMAQKKAIFLLTTLIGLNWVPFPLPHTWVRATTFLAICIYKMDSQAYILQAW
jgi:hypothetical protein